MFRFLVYSFLAAALVFNASCAGKKKKDEKGGGPIVTEGAGDIFNTNGSDSGKIAGLTTVHFEYDKARLTGEAKRQLSENAQWIKDKNVTVQVEGHCDSRGSVEYNMALGQRRAKSVKTYLVSLGVPAEKLTIISYGKEKPIAFGDSDSDHSQNRRANFLPLK